MQGKANKQNEFHFSKTVKCNKPSDRILLSRMQQHHLILIPHLAKNNGFATTIMIRAIDFLKSYTILLNGKTKISNAYYRYSMKY